MTDWGAGGRRDEYEFRLVDPFTLQETGEVVAAEAGASNITFGYYTDNKASCTLKLLNDVSRDKLIRVRHTVTAADGTVGEGAFGTFFVENDTAEAVCGSVGRSYDGYSTLLRFTDDVLVRDFYRAAGYNRVQAIRDLVEADGGRLVVGDGVDESLSHTVDVYFPVNTVRSEVLNQLADWSGWQIGVSEYGYVTLDRYVAPADKAESFTFEAGSNCVYAAGATLTDDRDDSYNRVLVYYSTEEASSSVWVDLEPSHPFSYERIGRRKSYVMQLNEPAGDDEMREMGASFLAANCGSTQYYEIEHVGVPGLRIGQTVRYVNERDCSRPVDCKCLVTEMDVTLGPGCWTKTKLKVVSWS